MMKAHKKPVMMLSIPQRVVNDDEVAHSGVDALDSGDDCELICVPSTDEEDLAGDDGVGSDDGAVDVDDGAGDIDGEPSDTDVEIVLGESLLQGAPVPSAVAYSERAPLLDHSRQRKEAKGKKKAQPKAEKTKKKKKETKKTKVPDATPRKTRGSPRLQQTPTKTSPPAKRLVGKQSMLTGKLLVWGTFFFRHTENSQEDREERGHLSDLRLES